MSDRPATVTPEQEAAWRCPRCGSSQSIGYGMWPNSGPLKAQCVPCGTVSDWPKIETDERPMSDHLDRAVEAVSRAIHEEDANASMSGVPWPEWDDLDTEGRLAYVPVAEGVLEALDAAGLLVSPEHDAAVAALPLPGDGCSCTPHEQDAGGGYTEYLLEYEPACPEHSEHLWDPTQGAWVLRSERDAAVEEDHDR